MDPHALPHVTCVLPVREDGPALADAVESILRQDYPGLLSVVIAVAPSDDDSEEVATQLAAIYPEVRAVNNPDGSTAAGLNAALAAAEGEVIARVDARARLGEGYLRQAVELLHATGAVNVGGIQAAIGTTTFTQAVAIAMRTPFGAGDARFRTGGTAGPVDTVYLGVFRREALEEVGGFDETLARNQDYELNIRLRERGGVVYFHPDLQVTYEPRTSLRALAYQYLEYGMWKREVVARHPASLRWRQVVPPLAVVANLFGLLGGLTRWRRLTLLVPATYVVATVAASLHAGRGMPPAVTARLPLVYATMHHAWGVGMLVGHRAGSSARIPGNAAGERA